MPAATGIKYILTLYPCCPIWKWSKIR